jgi:hypothetical protein
MSGYGHPTPYGNPKVQCSMTKTVAHSHFVCFMTYAPGFYRKLAGFRAV